MITIRSYQNADFSDVRTTLRETLMFDEVRDNRKNLQAKITLDPGSVLVAVDGNKAVGNVYLMYDGVFAFIFRLAVREAYRQQGVGSLLLEEAEKRLCQKGATRISLWIREEELAGLQPFYEKRGYKMADGQHQCMYKEF